MAYDSTEDTKAHIAEVAYLLKECAAQLEKRARLHDQSKFSVAEKPFYDFYIPAIKSAEYGSEIYRLSVEKLDTALEHHYANNSHHPEYYKNGIAGMNLFDVIEMLCDWMSRSDDIEGSIEYLGAKYYMPYELISILKNTADYWKEE